MIESDCQLVLLRGFARHQQHWGEFPEALANVVGGQTLCLDLPGTGTRADQLAPLSICANTDAIRPYFKAEASCRVLIAISLGGMVALDWLARYQDDFTHGVIINTSTARLSLPWQRCQPMAIARLLASRFCLTNKSKEKLILDTVSNEAEVRKQTHPLWTKVAEDAPVAPATILRQLIAATKFQGPQADCLRTPTLVLFSFADRLTHYSCSQRLVKYYNLPSQHHQTAGHDLPLDAAAWLCQRIEAFVTKT